MRVVFLMGPTGTGKTALSLALAERIPLDIVSVDSANVYRGMDIGTAKPSPAERAQVSHHLVDVADPAEHYSAGRFREDATVAIDTISASGRLPLLAGGTMLYFRALERGLSDLPTADPATRARIDDIALEKGWPEMHARLQEIDPAAAARIHERDAQRIQRALEVYELTGVPLSELQNRGEGALASRPIKIVLEPANRAVLAEHVEARFASMLAAGLVDEVRALRARGDLTERHPAMRAVGYRQIWSYLDGQIDLDEATRQAVVATRRLAKRQLTWLRRETDAIRLKSDAQDLIGRAEAAIRSAQAANTHGAVLDSFT